MNHSRARTLIERVFVDGTDAGVFGALRAHLDDCPACADLYRRYLHLESALCGTQEQPTMFSVERVRTSVMSRVVAAPARRSAMFRLSTWLAPIAAATLFLVWFAWPGAMVDDRVGLPADARLAAVELASKGGSVSDSSDVGVRMFRVVDGAAREVGTGLTLADVVTFSYTSYAPDIHYLTLLGIQPGGNIRWYFPGFGEDSSVRIASGRVDEPLDRGFRLDVNHESGPLRVVGIFSRQPLDRSVIEMAVGSSGMADVVALERAPIAGQGILQHSFLVRIGEGKGNSAVKGDGR